MGGGPKGVPALGTHSEGESLSPVQVGERGGGGWWKRPPRGVTAAAAAAAAASSAGTVGNTSQTPAPFHGAATKRHEK